MFRKLAVVAAITLSSQLFAEDSSVNDNVTEVANRLSGSYQNTEQAASPNYVLVKVQSCPVAVNNDGKYLYVEQTAVEYATRPYRQRIYRLSSAGGDSVLSTIYRIENQDEWVGACQKQERVPMAPAESLIDINCAVKLDKFENVYHGSTLNGGCPTNFNGAVKATSTVTVYENGFDAWDRGYDSNDNQVWGPTGGPYKFR